jgi:N utilization substance protein B
MGAPRQGRSGVDLAARSRARRRALQAVYAWQVSATPMPRVVAQFEHEQEMEIADIDYFRDLALGVERERAVIDTRLRDFLDREVDEVDPIERAVLRIAAFELLHRIDVPYRVVLNEAIEVSKRFGSENGHTYVNSVLDNASAQWRADEYRR